jgi:hypothetical protein
VDLAYLYYLPFCMVFVSNDRLHERCVPCSLTEHKAIVDGWELSVDQEFVSGRNLKADLAKLDGPNAQRAGPRPPGSRWIVVRRYFHRPHTYT